MDSVKLKDAPRILRNRFAFFRGEMFEAAGKDLLYRVLASEPELSMLEAIENLFEPTTYVAKPGCHVDFLTPEVCRQIHMIFRQLGLDKDGSGQNAGACVSGPETQQDSKLIRGGKCKRARIK